MKKKNYVFLLSGLLFIVIIISSINTNSQFPAYNQEENETPKIAGNLEGAENILVTELVRAGNVSGYGMVNIKDKITIQNNNENPIDSMFIGIPLRHSDDLIYYQAYGENENSLVIDRLNIVMNEFEMLIIYFDSPLLPYQSTTVYFFQSFKNLFTYNLFYEPDLQVHQNFTFTVWPILPYRAEGYIYTTYQIPSTAERLYFERVGSTGNEDDTKTYRWDLSKSLKYDHLEPFLANLEDAIDANNGKEFITILFQDTVLKFAEIHVEEINREIHISPWGIIKVEENFLIQNHGYFNQRSVSVNIPSNAKNVKVIDDLGELSFTIDNTKTNNRKKLEVNLIQNRAFLTPSSKVKLLLTYDLPFNDYFSANWLQQSLKMNLITSQFEYLVKKQTINIIIEGCGTIDYISTPPNAIGQSGSSKILTYYSDYVSPIENENFLITYTIDLFDLLLRPLLIMLIIAILLSLYTLIIKSKKSEEEILTFKKELMPISEIREFCSLYEEKNALTLEIRKAEEDAKRKKLAKKTYKSILTKNATKIEQIKEEIIPFKKDLAETNETFNNIIKKLDVLDAERVSVDDSLNLLDNRYKKGRLPSKAAYEKLANDFLNRRKKIDRTIDRYIQQLRSYLL
jgi:hypothetical protein